MSDQQALNAMAQGLYMDEALKTVWFAYYTDLSGFAAFRSEMEALRFAVEHSMRIKRIQLPCEDVRGELIK